MTDATPGPPTPVDPRTGPQSELPVLDRFRMDGRVAVITGASSGLGAGFARALSSAGATVVLAARRRERLEALADELCAAGGRASTVACDVADPEACAAMTRAAMEAHGRIDVLVNNAGIGTAVPALKETPEQFRSVVDVNLNGAFWAAKECAAVMGPGSSIVNVASVLGLTAGFAPQAAYSATKAAVMGLTRDLASQWGGRRGIRVNSLAPGYFASEMTDEIPEAMLADITGRTIFGRLGLQPELDAALLFLASDASSFITGTTLVVDGGMTLH
ncbi:SDR family NAD(P)-dependent oxidoreductase [Dietzia sp. UBA5065]|uniref:SDR family NAD(P)-dependent oxidoreductase n=1 Tax=Dietzia sp. UBA5065 TaxID=1946422 RepID=UPI0025BA8E53|nr:SDR family NAD(P)-dependent oxidoreductase [Dietzia sp. UBA5065]